MDRAGEIVSAQEAVNRFVEILTEEGVLKMDNGNMDNGNMDEMAEALGYAREMALFGSLSALFVAALREAKGDFEWHDRTMSATALLDKGVNGLEARHILRFWGKT
jgi:hypothetical protein